MDDENNWVKHLDMDEFASALRKGQGRAKLHVLNFGLDEVADLVLEACIHNQVYDQQVESGRANWLFSMFKETVYYLEFRLAILNSLRIETESYNLFQLLGLTRNIADQGDSEAIIAYEQTVYRLAADPASDIWLGIEDLLELKGAEAMLNLARIYGQRLLADPNDFVNDYLLQYAGHPEFPEILMEYSKKDNLIRIYQVYLEAMGRVRLSTRIEDRETQKLRHHNQVRKEYSLNSILEDARNLKGSYPGHYVTFGKHANVEELEVIYDELLTESDHAVRTRMLWVFRRTKVPRLDEKLFEWANAPEDDLRAASISALAQISDESVHVFARKKLESRNFTGVDPEVFELFINNYDVRDAELINKRLVDLQPDLHDAHSIGLSLIKLADRYEDPGLAASVVWTYENTPCTHCRHATVLWLNHHLKLSDEQRFECKFDAEEEIRALVIK
jgi:hypothetical protein